MKTKLTSAFIGTRVEIFKALQLKTDLKFVVCEKSSRVYKHLKNKKIKKILYTRKNKEKIFKILKTSKVNLILSAGFPYIIPKKFFDKKKILINSHPSLLPKYKGIDAINDALRNGETRIGVTVHYITKKIDSGKTIYQKSLYVKDLAKSQIYNAIFSILEPYVLFQSLKLIKKK